MPEQAFPESQYNLANEISLGEEKVWSRKLRSLEKASITGLGLRAGREIAEHSTPVPAVLIVLEGTLDFTLGADSFRLKSGNSFSIPADEKHALYAVNDCRLLLAR